VQGSVKNRVHSEGLNLLISRGIAMKTPKSPFWLAVIVLSPISYLRAQENVRPEPPPKYEMELVYISEAGSTEFIFLIGNVGFKSVATLKNLVGNLAPGSTYARGRFLLHKQTEPAMKKSIEYAKRGIAQSKGGGSEGAGDRRHARRSAHRARTH
jgi:hypothetical protein